MTLAIFDLDNTLLAGDSDYLWGEYLTQKGIVDAGEYQQANEKFYQDYIDGCLDIVAFSRFVFTVLKNHNLEQLKTWRQDYIEKKIKPIIAKKAPALIQQHKAKGDTLLIITATNSFITHPIAKLLKIDNIIATTPEFDGKQFTGELAGTPCFKDGKVIRLNTWLKENNLNLEGSYFYSDSHNDLPLLKLVDHPIAVDADTKLLNYAKQNNWQSISLRNE